MAQPYPIISNGAVAIEKLREARQLLLHLIPQHTCLTYLMALKHSAAVICLTSVKSNALTDSCCYAMFKMCLSERKQKSFNVNVLLTL